MKESMHEGEKRYNHIRSKVRKAAFALAGVAALSGVVAPLTGCQPYEEKPPSITSVGQNNEGYKVIEAVSRYPDDLIQEHLGKFAAKECGPVSVQSQTAVRGVDGVKKEVEPGFIASNSYAVPNEVYKIHVECNKQ